MIQTIILECVFSLLLCVNIFSQSSIALSTNYKSSTNYIHISGKTNINCFECKYIRTEATQSPYHFSWDLLQPAKSIYELLIPVREFECSNNMIYDDFQSLLKAFNHPSIRIGIDPSEIKVLTPDASVVDLTIYITIANVTKAQSISCSVIDFNHSRVCISGEASIQLTDFQIKPPVKFLGLVKVKDEVTISFSFNFIVS